MFWHCKRCHMFEKEVVLCTRGHVSCTPLMLSIRLSQSKPWWIPPVEVRQKAQQKVRHWLLLLVKARIANHSQKSSFRVILRSIRTWKTLTIHRTARRPACVRWNTMHWNTIQRCWSKLALDSISFWISIHIIWSMATNTIATMS